GRKELQRKSVEKEARRPRHGDRRVERRSEVPRGGNGRGPLPTALDLMLPPQRHVHHAPKGGDGNPYVGGHASAASLRPGRLLDLHPLAKVATPTTTSRLAGGRNLRTLGFVARRP